MKLKRTASLQRCFFCWIFVIPSFWACPLDFYERQDRANLGKHAGGQGIHASQPHKEPQPRRGSRDPTAHFDARTRHCKVQSSHVRSLPLNRTTSCHSFHLFQFPSIQYISSTPGFHWSFDPRQSSLQVTQNLDPEINPSPDQSRGHSSIEPEKFRHHIHYILHP